MHLCVLSLVLLYYTVCPPIELQGGRHICLSLPSLEQKASFAYSQTKDYKDMKMQVVCS